MARQFTGTQREIVAHKELSGDRGEMAWLIKVAGGPDAHTVTLRPGEVIDPHYHTQNQWQIVLEGSCTLDGERLEPLAVHFAEARTPYGPIVAGEGGLTFLTLREEPAGIHYIDDEEDGAADPRG